MLAISYRLNQARVLLGNNNNESSAHYRLGQAPNRAKMSYKQAAQYSISGMGCAVVALMCDAAITGIMLVGPACELIGPNGAGRMVGD